MYITWLRPNSNVPIFGYRLYRERYDDGGNMVDLDALYQFPPDPHSDSQVVPGSHYGYNVRAYNSAGRGPRSDVANITVNLPDSVPGPMIGRPLLIEETRGEVIVEWSALTPTSGAAVDKYRIRRRACCRNNWSQVAVVEGSATAYTDDTVEPNTRDTITPSLQRAPAAQPQSPGSRITTTAESTLDPPDGFTATTSRPEVLLSWNAVAVASGYMIRRFTIPISGTSALYLIEAVGGDTVSERDESLYHSQLFCWL